MKRFIGFVTLLGLMSVFAITEPVQAVAAPTVTSVISSGSTSELNVISASRSSNIATLTTDFAHGYHVGDSVTVRDTSDTSYTTYPASVEILSVPTSTTFTYANAGSNSSSAVLTAGTSKFGSLRISNAALTSNVVTLTTENKHGLAINDYVTISDVKISGVSQDFMNGLFQVVAVPTSTTFTYAVTHADVTSASTSNWGVATRTNGTAVNGTSVLIKVNFSVGVNVTGFPTITMETGATDRTAFCSSCGSTLTNVTSLTFSYLVQQGDRSTDLNYQSVNAILFNDATVVANADTSVTADLTLPALSSSNSLAGTSSVIVAGSSREDEQWQSPLSSTRGLHGLQLSEDLRENVSYLIKYDSSWANPKACSYSITNVALTSNVATIIVADKNPDFAVGDSVTLSGASNTVFNGTFTVSSVSGSAFSFAKTNADILSSAVSAGRVARDCSASNIGFRSVLQACTSDSDTNCIEGVYASSTTVTEKTGSVDSSFPARGVSDFASPRSGVPAGGSSTIYTFSNFPHSYGNQYLVTVSLDGWMYGNGTLGSNKVFASITPTSIRNTNCDVDHNGQCLDEVDGSVAVDQDGGYRCVAWDVVESNTDSDTKVTYGGSDVSSCALKHAFPAGVRFKLKIRTAVAPGGWIHGRMSDPSITLTESGSNTILTAEAAPVAVPTVGAAGPYASLTTEVKDWFAANCSTNDQNSCGTRFPDNSWTVPSTRMAIMSPAPYNASAISQLNLWTNFINDTAGAIPTHWNIRTLSTDEMSSASTCISGVTGVAGIVTTNSTLYSMGPPSYNTTTKTLDYQVAAPHYQPDGVTPFVGEYHLLLREDVAQCLYGFTGTDVTSDVSVQSAEGIAKTATTSITKSGTWYNFSASGFSFSSPTIKAKLTKVSAVSVTPVVAPNATPAVTVPVVTVPVVTVPSITPKIGTPLVLVVMPQTRVASDLGIAVTSSEVRVALKVPSIAKGVTVKNYVVTLRTLTGQIVSTKTISSPKPDSSKSLTLSGLKTGTYRLEIAATDSKGAKLPKWTSPQIKIKK